MTKFQENNQEETFNNLNSDLDKLHTWANKWFMSFNASKTDYVVFSNKKHKAYPQMKMNDIELTRVSEHTHLGLTLQENMNWESHLNNIIKKATLKMGVMWQFSGSLPRLCLERYYTSSDQY
jgi:hypothetical protein